MDNAWFGIYDENKPSDSQLCDTNICFSNKER